MASLTLPAGAITNLKKNVWEMKEDSEFIPKIMISVEELKSFLGDDGYETDGEEISMLDVMFLNDDIIRVQVDTWKKKFKQKIRTLVKSPVQLSNLTASKCMNYIGIFSIERILDNTNPSIIVDTLLLVRDELSQLSIVFNDIGTPLGTSESLTASDKKILRERFFSESQYSFGWLWSTDSNDEKMKNIVDVKIKIYQYLLAYCNRNNIHYKAVCDRIGTFITQKAKSILAINNKELDTIRATNTSILGRKKKNSRQNRSREDESSEEEDELGSVGTYSFFNRKKSSRYKTKEIIESSDEDQSEEDQGEEEDTNVSMCKDDTSDQDLGKQITVGVADLNISTPNISKPLFLGQFNKTTERERLDGEQDELVLCHSNDPRDFEFLLAYCSIIPEQYLYREIKPNQKLAVRVIQGNDDGNYNVIFEEGEVLPSYLGGDYSKRNIEVFDYEDVEDDTPHISTLIDMYEENTSDDTSDDTSDNTSDEETTSGKASATDMDKVKDNNQKIARLSAELKEVPTGSFYYGNLKTRWNEPKVKIFFLRYIEDFLFYYSEVTYLMKVLDDLFPEWNYDYIMKLPEKIIERRAEINRKNGESYTERDYCQDVILKNIILFLAMEKKFVNSAKMRSMYPTHPELEREIERTKTYASRENNESQDIWFDKVLKDKLMHMNKSAISDLYFLTGRIQIPLCGIGFMEELITSNNHDNHDFTYPIVN